MKKKETPRQRIWLVSCVVDSITRLEGIWELSPESHFASANNYRETPTRKFKLNNTQRSKLREALFEIKILTYEDIGLINLIIKKKDKQILDFLIKKLKENKFTKLGDDFFMEKVAELSNRDDLKEIIKKIDNLNYMDDGATEKANQI